MLDVKAKERYENNIPEYLRKDIEALKKGEEENSLSLDCLIDEVYGSINSALYSYEITEEQANYLRDKYCYGIEK